MADLESIIQTAVNESKAASAESSDVPVIEAGETATETPETPIIATETPTEGETAVVTPAVVVEEDPFAKEHGLSPKDKAGTRENRIPYSNVKKIVGNAEAKLAEAVLGRPLATGEKAFDVVKTHVARIPELETKVQGYETELSSVRGVEEIMVNDCERFLAMLPTVNPRYAELLAGKIAPATPVVDATATPMPQPDFDLGEGKGKTYSEQGLQKLMDWRDQQTEKRVLKSMEDRFKPLTSRADAEAQAQAMYPRIKARVDAARAQWDGFRENEQEILTAVQAANAANKEITLHDAYISVINKKHKEFITSNTANEDKIRKKVLDEINKRPGSTSVVGTAPASKVVVADPDMDPIEAAIRNSIKDLKR